MLTDLIRSIIEKVQSIINSKSNIRASIINKEVAVPEEAKLSEMPAYIDQIETDGINTSDATATEADILLGASAYVNNELIVGSLEKQEKTVTPTTDGFDVTPDEGKLLSKVTVEKIKSGELSVPVIELEESTGLITATSNFSEGYSSDASQENTLQLSTQSGKEITPSTKDQTAISKGKFAKGNITVKGDSDLLPENIKKDVTIFDVTGTYSPSDISRYPYSFNNFVINSHRITMKCQLNWLTFGDYQQFLGNSCLMMMLPASQIPKLSYYDSSQPGSIAYLIGKLEKISDDEWSFRHEGDSVYRSINGLSAMGSQSGLKYEIGKIKLVTNVEEYGSTAVGSGVGLVFNLNEEIDLDKGFYTNGGSTGDEYSIHFYQLG